MHMPMKRLIFCHILACLLLSGCMKDPELGTTKVGEGEVWATLDFGHTDYEQIKITTRSTLGLIAESRVSNLYVFLFNSNGERVYGHYFDSENERQSAAEVTSANSNCWYVNNLMSASEQTTGTIRMKLPQLTGGTFWLVANLDTDMLNISSEKFGFIQTIDELKAMVAVMNQEITSRNGSFTMTGCAENTTITSNGITYDDGGARTNTVVASRCKDRDAYPRCRGK